MLQWLATNIVNLIAAIASVIAAVATCWLVWQQRRSGPVVTLNIEPIARQPGWYSVLIRIATDEPAPLKAGTLRIRRMLDTLPRDAARREIPVDLRLGLIERRDRDHGEFFLLIASNSSRSLSLTLSLTSQDQALRKTTISIRAVAPIHPAMATI